MVTFLPTFEVFAANEQIHRQFTAVDGTVRHLGRLLMG
jgi:hypothetical protein